MLKIFYESIQWLTHQSLTHWSLYHISWPIFPSWFKFNCFHSALIPVVVMWSLWNFAHARQLCCPGMCNILWWCDLLHWSYTKKKISIKFEYHGRIFGEMDPTWCICVSELSQHFVEFNSLAPGRFERNSRYVTFQLIVVIVDWCLSCEFALKWMLQDLTDDKSTLVQVMAWCHQATSHYLSQCWPSSPSPYGVPKPQWVKKVPLKFNTK